MNVQTDTLGRLALRGIHDSLITELRFSRANGVLSFGLTSNDGTDTSISTDSLDMLNMSGFWEGSIVSDVFVWEIANVPDSYVFDSEVGWRHLFEGRITDKSEIKAQIARCEKRMPTGKMVSISCSYGASISFLCNDIVVTQHSSVISN